MEWKEFFYFNKSDRMVVLFLVVLGSVIMSLFLLFDTDADLGVPKSEPVANADSAQRYRHTDGISYAQSSDYAQPSASHELFYFDPNTADSTQFLRLGLKPWQVRGIYKYRASGGVYAKPTDFARVYGLTVRQYRQLEPYIRISEDYRMAADVIKETSMKSNDTVAYPVKLTPQQRISVNAADTTMLKKVPGIGSYYARKIVGYRQKLGGFVDLNQLNEIDGLPEEALQYMCIPDGEVRKLNVNKLTLNQLKAHPYINFYQARAIVDYRKQKGLITDLDDLRLHPDFPPEAIERLRPYVEY